MKAFMFDPVEQATTCVDVAGWDATKELLGCDIMSEMLINGGEINLHGVKMSIKKTPTNVRVVVFHDDEGFLVDENAVMEFSYRGGRKTKLAGRCVLAAYWVSEDGDSEFIDLNLPLKVVDEMVTYLDTKSGDYRIRTTTTEGPDVFVVHQTLEEVPRETENKS